MAERNRWPQLMDEQTARAYLTFSKHDFNALIAAGLIPRASEPLPGMKRWHRRDLDQASERMFNLEIVRKEKEAKLATRRAIQAFRPPPLRHGSQAQRSDVAVLPARREDDRPPRA